jgi:hypothetical protein
MQEMKFHIAKFSFFEGIWFCCDAVKEDYSLVSNPVLRLVTWQSWTIDIVGLSVHKWLNFELSHSKYMYLLPPHKRKHWLQNACSTIIYYVPCV